MKSTRTVGAPNLALQIIPSGWVYKAKQISDTPLSQEYKAKVRWIIRGNLLNKDYMESYAPVVNEATNKLLFALAVHRGWKIRKGDVTLTHGRAYPSRKTVVTSAS